MGLLHGATNRSKHVTISSPLRETDNNICQVCQLLTDLTHIVVSFPQGRTNRNIIINNVNSPFASLDFACLNPLLLVSTFAGFHYTFMHYMVRKLVKKIR